MSALVASLPDYASLVREELESYLEAALVSHSARLAAAMRYSTLAGGKRLRAVLGLALADSLGVSRQVALPYYAGIECIHAMSLIHDDLPCMDDDDLRRGQPSCHRQFDEATALLAGDALLVLGLALPLQIQKPATVQAALVGLLAQSSGAAGMTAGQMLDLEATGAEQSLAELQQIHQLKTGALFRAVCVGAAILAEQPADSLVYRATERFAEELGLAFQIADDLLDATATSAQLGKTAGKDLAQAKLTYVKLHGLTESKHLALAHANQAKRILCEEICVPSQLLIDLCDLIVKRVS